MVGPLVVFNPARCLQLLVLMAATNPILRPMGSFA
jgi:hypothetical protein